MAEFENRFWSSRDGLKLHYRDYPGREDRPPLLCLPGLTRNARDFAALAARHAGEWRVICPDLRGRGDSDWAKDAASYNPLQYVEDVELLLGALGLEWIVAVGTSLGGLMTAILSLKHPGLVAGAVLGDIGPVIEEAGLARIRGYVGQGRAFATWMHAARALEESQAVSYPGYSLDDWLAMAKRVMTVGSNGRIVFDYDMKIAEPFEQAKDAPPLDLWPAFESLGGRPLLCVRGALSDILSAETLVAMMARLPGLETLTVPGVGHAPTLDEPEACEAVGRLLGRIG
ncbi:alpha/beta hydrolase [Novosphingobium flavum]|uniref:Alpha/beta hydrolase n=1 Tax=Novosphingobium flavum TaxID=1778672 RepID=A0A7X1FSU1_9SPHN|nr:alpha/beta hydrolase [Novosphingobium flavum]MBC2665822.1 alpha/beta hydrolase [Novosphingobium flavum]